MSDISKTQAPTPAAGKPAEKRIISMKSVSFEVDRKAGKHQNSRQPMVAHKIQMQCQDNARFAQTINTNITKLFYDYLIYKVRMRENLNIAIKGETRSGKSTVALSLGSFISSMTKVPYTPYHICASESEYYSKVKNAKFMELYHIDEQKESKVWLDDSNQPDKFGSGSFREEMGIMDIQNIIAKQAVHTIWIYPSDACQFGWQAEETSSLVIAFMDWKVMARTFRISSSAASCARLPDSGSQGENDLRKTVMGMSIPLGYIITPKLQDAAYQKLPEDKWSPYRLKNKHELKRGDFDSPLEESYEQTFISHPN